MEDHPGVVNTDNSIPSDPEPSGAMASVIIIRKIIKDNLRNKYHKKDLVESGRPTLFSLLLSSHCTDLTEIWCKHCQIETAS